MQNKLLSKKRYYSGRKPETEHTHDLQWPHLLSSDLGLLLASSESAALKASSFCSYSSLQWKELSVGVLGLRSILPWWIENLAKKKKILPCTYRPPCEEEGRECCRKIYLLNKSETCNLSLFSKYKFIIFYYFFLNISLYAFPRHSLKIFVAVLFFFFPCSTYAGYTEEAIVFFFFITILYWILLPLTVITWMQKDALYLFYHPLSFSNHVTPVISFQITGFIFRSNWWGKKNNLPSTMMQY